MRGKKLKIGVIFGGRSGEHEVSLRSAEAVMKALDTKKYQIIPIGITKEGKWLATGNPLKALKRGRSGQITEEAEPIINPSKKGFLRAKNGMVVMVDVVFPVLHGTYGEDGSLQGLCEMANIPYVGSRVLGSALGMDKITQKKLFRDAELPIADFIGMTKHEWEEEMRMFSRKIEKMGFPVFVKPANAGSSVGISKVKRRRELFKAVKEAFRYDSKVIVERGFEDAREIECSVLGNDEPEVSLPGEVISYGEFYDYNAKYLDDRTEMIVPAKLSPTLIRALEDLSKKAFLALDLCGMARVDFFLVKRKKKIQIFINEVNTIPGFTEMSMYPKMWEASGLPFRGLVTRLVQLALDAHKEKMNIQTSYLPKVNWSNK